MKCPNFYSCGLCEGDTKDCVFNFEPKIDNIITCKNQQKESLKVFNEYAVSYYNNLACNIHSNIVVAEGVCRNNNVNTDCTGFNKDCIPFICDAIEAKLIILEN